MTYPGDGGEVSASFRPTSDVPPLARRTSSVRFVAPGSVTRGQFGLFEWNMKPKAGGPDPHFHRTFSESFYVMSGQVRLYDGSRWVEATAGDFIYVPMGGIHAFKNDSDATAAMQIVYATGAPREKYYEETALIAESGRTLTTEEWTELYARHDQYMV
jgi:mannose-6-phosphate isomerase-like protein (cupin superfamily)